MPASRIKIRVWSSNILPQSLNPVQSHYLSHHRGSKLRISELDYFKTCIYILARLEDIDRNKIRKK